MSANEIKATDDVLIRDLKYIADTYCNTKSLPLKHRATLDGAAERLAVLSSESDESWQLRKKINAAEAVLFGVTALAVEHKGDAIIRRIALDLNEALKDG